MRDIRRVMVGSMKLELLHLRNSKVFLGLVMLEAVTFIVLVSLFGLTGAHAPTAIIDRDHTAESRAFIQYLKHDHRSFKLEAMTQKQADEKLSSGDLVARITIPHGFAANLKAARTVNLPLVIDNVNADFTDDIRRALPAGIAAFGEHLREPGIRALPVEKDDISHDTDYIPYLVVSALVLDALVLGGVLAATAVAREWEEGTVKVWRLSPANAVALLGGKIIASAMAAGVGLAAAFLLVVGAYGVAPEHWLEAIGVLIACVVIFSCLGACLGALVRRTLPVVSLLFGVVMPLYLISGALEPLRFDGEGPWHEGHFTPTYWAIGVLEHAFHGLRVTPESVSFDALVTGLWAVGALLLAVVALNGTRFFERVRVPFPLNLGSGLRAVRR